MRLRARLVLVAGLMSVPVVVASGWLHAWVREHTMEELLAEWIGAEMQSGGGREVCEAWPEAWGGLRRPLPLPPGLPPPGELRPLGLGRPIPAASGTLGGIAVWAYDASLSSRNSGAPALDAQMLQDFSNHTTLLRAPGPEPHSPHRLLVRMPWAEGPCAYVLLERRGPPPPGLEISVLPPPQVLLIPIAVVISTILLALGPVVRRARRLTREVRIAAASHYTLPISTGGRDEIGELARAFDDAAREIRAHIEHQEAREQTLRNFLENTTHDVMIPLTVLQGHLAAMREHVEAGRIAGAGEVASAIDEAHYMASLIHNLSAAAKLEAGEPAVARLETDLGSVVARAVARHLPIARQRRVSLEKAVPEHPVLAEGDVTLMEQAASNVIYNAIRYNRPQGHVAVVLDTADHRFRLRVIDDGPGIPDAELSRLLERRFRGNAARTREPAGEGLGLNIAWRIARLHAWELQLRRSEHGGLEVEFSGPLTSPER